MVPDDPPICEGSDVGSETADTEVEQPPSRPTGVVASTHRADSVELQWATVAGASGYRVERCALPCEAGWSTLANVEAAPYVDEAVAVPSLPEPPNDVAATTTLPARVEVTWSAVTAPTAQRYRYRVFAVGPDGQSDESAPSDTAEGAVAERPVTGYEVLLEGQWLGVAATSWSDDSAAPPSLTAGTAAASQATSSTHVALTVSGATASPGESRGYAVRVLTAYGWSRSSATVSGNRRAGTLTYRWERSAGPSAEDFAPITGATATTYNDTDAPADGSTRWYRVVVSADGAAPVTSEAVAGSRQGAPNVPQAVQASGDKVDRVDVSWQPVAGAIGYHVYRDGTKLTTGNGVAVTTYSDLEAPAATQVWGAPAAVAATTNQHDKVVVTWVAPTRPQGAAVAYTVTAVNPAGEGPVSSEAIGRRVAVALAGFDVEVTPSGGNATWIATGSTETSWNHMTAPAGVITPGTITASLGTMRAHVALTSSGASVSTPASVTYRVRGALANNTTTAASGTATGRRTVGSLVRSWERALPGPDPDFDDLGASTVTYNDTSAPSDGSARLYRLALSATGATSRVLEPIAGWRLAFTSVTVGSGHTCARATDGRVWCWGAGTSGQLGRGTTLDGAIGRINAPVPEPAFTEIAAGRAHTCVLTSSGAVWCWGDNEFGQLGDGSTLDRAEPVEVSLNAPAVSLSCGYDHTCVALDTGAVRCWGYNQMGQLGDRSNTARTTPVTVRDSSFNALSNAVEVAAGRSHTCARTTTGSVVCWGYGDLGQLGNGSSASTNFFVPVSGLTLVVELAAGGEHTCARRSTGQVRCWGNNEVGTLGDGTYGWSNVPTSVAGIGSAAALGSGSDVSCAFTSGGVTYCWGWDLYGALGDGGELGENASNQPVEVASLDGITNLSKASSQQRVCAVVHHELFCWGADSGPNQPAPVGVTLP